MKNVKIQEQGNNEFLPIYNFNISDNNLLNSDKNNLDINFCEQNEYFQIVMQKYYLINVIFYCRSYNHLNFINTKNSKYNFYFFLRIN